ncbi:MAG: phenylalanine--tRNA ligase subunit beta, partial [Firmicutes bacterium]|nr:phenylalanine--tRNA ligase subunit beta [Bacillota bacterium]
MDVPISWLNDFIKPKLSTKELADALTLSGSKAEGIKVFGGEISGIVAGKILKTKKHPNADKLQICTVDIGQKEPLTIVTGATNIYEGAYVPVATDGASLADGKRIYNGELRGVASCGMLCSVEELGCDGHDFPEAPEHGIYIFPEPVELGEDVVKLMDLFDETIEFEITSNRPDCFSVVGIARETAATLGQKFELPEINLKEEASGKAEELISVEIADPEMCSRYCARIVKNVKIGPSPRWMRKRLRSAGVRPINNMVDVTNYVMIELGQPMHAFDINTIDERRIIVRSAKEGEKFTTLDGTERILDSGMTMITDINKAVGIGGIMGGENSMISENADGVLLEAACFNGPNIRISAKKLGMRTDASAIFEKGIDPNLARYAVDRAAELIEQLGIGDIVPGVVDCYPNVRKEWSLDYSADWINALLGTEMTEQEITGYFELLGIKADGKTAIIPTWRPDLEGQADLAEEAARLYGYDKIKPTLAAGTPTVGKRNRLQTIRALLKQNAVSAGFCEAKTFTFESPKVFEKLLIPKDHPLRDAVEIQNPLGEDYSLMRTTTLNGMLVSLATNYNRRNEKACLFEVGRIFLPKEKPLVNLPEEREILTLGAYGDMDFYDMKGVAERFLKVLGLSDGIEFNAKTDILWMHPGRTASVSILGKELGYIGELHPLVAENYGIGTRVYIAALDIRLFAENARLIRTFEPLPRYPAITRDIAVVVKEELFTKDIESAIREKGGQYLEKVTLFDVYTGQGIEKGYKSNAYSLVFRAADRTLKVEDVDKEIE